MIGKHSTTSFVLLFDTDPQSRSDFMHDKARKNADFEIRKEHLMDYDETECQIYYAHSRNKINQ